MGIRNYIRKLPATIGLTTTQEVTELEQKYNRSIASIYEELSLWKDQGIHFLDRPEIGYSEMSAQRLGYVDRQVSPTEIFDTVHKDTYFSGLFDQLIKTLFKRGFFVDINTSPKGRLLGNKRTARKYEDKLKEINYLDLSERYLYGTYGDGGGNTIVFTTRGDRGLEVKLENFLDKGIPRVKVFGNDRRRIITKYEVVDTQDSAVYTLPVEGPQKTYVKQFRYSRGGDYRFSSNPSKRAAYWFRLKKYIAGSNQSAFENGLQEPTLMTPDWGAIAPILEHYSKQVGGINKDEFWQDPIKYFTKQGKVDIGILREEAGRVRTANKYIRLLNQYKFEKIGRSNLNMQSKEFINICDEQMGYALRSSKGIISTVDSKYSNAEIEIDNWKGLVADPILSEFENLAMEALLPIFFPDYNPDIYPVRFGRDPDQEEIQIWETKVNRNKTTGEILEISSRVEGWDYNPATNEWEKTDGEKVKKDSMNKGTDETKDDIVDEADEEVTGERKKKDDIKVDDFGFVMLSLSSASAIEEAQETIKKEDLFESDEEWSDGISNYLHLTIGAMLTKKAKISDIKKIVNEFHNRDDNNREFSIESIDYFSPEDKDYDVVVAKVSKDGLLSDVNAKLMELDNKNQFDSYLPHVSIAYVKRGKGKDYKQKLRASFLYGDIVYSAPGSTKRKSLLIQDRKCRAVDSNIVSENEDSAAVKSFEKSVNKAMTKQLERYARKLSTKSSVEQAIKDLDKDLTPISNNGLTVASYKQQILRIAKPGIKEFEKTTNTKVTKRQEADFAAGKDVLKLFDSKAQAMVKGSNTLTKAERASLRKIFGRDIALYKGLDAETSNQINTILRGAMETGVGIDDVQGQLTFLIENATTKDILDGINDLEKVIQEKGFADPGAISKLDDLKKQAPNKSVGKKIDSLQKLMKDASTDSFQVKKAVVDLERKIESMSSNRAKTISITENVQSIEGARLELYSGTDWNFKKWDTVNDSNVRDSHRANEDEGFIPIDDTFEGTDSKSPAEEINCRCSLRYSQTKEE
jgi:2'-5' RNA ligase